VIVNPEAGAQSFFAAPLRTDRHSNARNRERPVKLPSPNGAPQEFFA